jgi:hypothetical protein
MYNDKICRFSFYHLIINHIAQDDWQLRTTCNIWCLIGPSRKKCSFWSFTLNYTFQNKANRIHKIILNGFWSSEENRCIIYKKVQFVSSLKLPLLSDRSVSSCRLNGNTWQHKKIAASINLFNISRFSLTLLLTGLNGYCSVHFEAI